jgi:predicted alpha/beta hydrolase
VAANARALELTSADGTRLHASLFEAREPVAGLVMVHGMQSHAGWFEAAGTAVALAAAGITCLAYDRRGSGRSGGTPGHAARADDMLADLDVMADESFHTRESLEKLIGRRAATAVNARISKCGGLIATRNRCREALAAGLWVQVGCQVGESSLLSAAHLRLCAAVGVVRYAEGCFGRLLLAKVISMATNRSTFRISFCCRKS